MFVSRWVHRKKIAEADLPGRKPARNLGMKKKSRIQPNALVSRSVPNASFTRTSQSVYMADENVPQLRALITEAQTLFTQGSPMNDRDRARLLIIIAVEHLRSPLSSAGAQMTVPIR